LLIAPVSQNNFEALARAVGQPQWLQDPRFANVHAREHHWGELMALLDEWAADRSAEECESIMNEGGVPCSRYFTVKEAMQAPPIVERGVLQSIDDGSGPFKVTNPAFRFKHTQAQARNRVPDLGADGPDLLRSLGCDEGTIEQALADGTLTSTHP
jgi:crotonobetainyl-CoA:carnitine CoA-transferase CaiB-like acyl-CoA transferase